MADREASRETMATTTSKVFAVLLLLHLFHPSNSLFLPFNTSIHYLSPLPNPDPPPPLPSNSLLQDVVRAIATKQRWEGSVRVSQVEEASIRVGESRRYEFQIQYGRSGGALVLKFSDEVEEWRRAEGSGVELIDGRFGEGRRRDLDGVELEGPVEVRVGGGGDDGRLSLLLPSLNVTHNGLRKVLVGHGITVRVEGAQEVTLFHPYDIRASLNGSSATCREERTRFWSIGLPSCAPILTLQVLGSASLVAFRTRNFEGHLDTLSRSSDSVELLPEKCYSNGQFKQVSSCSFPNLSLRLALLENLLRSLLGKNIFQESSIHLVKAKIGSSTLVKFRVELEREITQADRVWQKVEAWRTKAVVERIWYDIVARVEQGKGLKQVIARKLSRPPMIVESTAWSNLMSNISFTQFPSIVVPPEALTLDVKW